MSFPLLELPSLAIRKVIGLMLFDEKVKLALSHKQMEDVMKIEKIKGEYLHLTIGKICHSNLMDEEKSAHDDEIFNVGKFVYERGGHFSGRENDIVERKNFINESIQLSERIQTIFRDSKEIWLFDMYSLRYREISEYTELCARKNPYECVVSRGFEVRGQFRESDFDLFMNNIGSQTKMRMNIDTDFPYYSSLNAFKFKNMHYKYSHWVRPYDLHTIRNIDTITLENGAFHSENLNQLVIFWIHCDSNMMRDAVIENQERFRLDRSTILRWIVAKKRASPVEGQDKYFILGRNSNTRSDIIGILSFTNNGIRFSTRRPDEGYAREFRALRIQRQRIRRRRGNRQ